MDDMARRIMAKREVPYNRKKDDSCVLKRHQKMLGCGFKKCCDAASESSAMPSYGKASSTQHPIYHASPPVVHQNSQNQQMN